jgi:hypothetical protein
MHGRRSPSAPIGTDRGRAALSRRAAHRYCRAERGSARTRPTEAEALLKRISTLKRRPELSEDDFRREWIVHRDLVCKMPGVAGYRQNVVIARERIKGQPRGYDELPIDGVVELWFEDPAVLEAAFASPAGRTTMKHARTFLAEITAFAVEEHRVV